MAPVQAEPGSITLQPGETLSYISALYGVSEKDLIAWNGLNSAHDVRAGQRLAIRPPVTQGALSARTGRATEPAPQPAAPARNETASDGTITVVAGQSLFGIAAQYKVSTADLRRWNKLKSDQLQIGQKLRVAAPVRVHTIKAGENLTGIAARYKVSVNDLIQKNKLANADVLPVGKELIIP
jgi:LysM repeat protein